MMTTAQLKKAIKTAEKARSNWNGIGDIPVTYDALCEMRSQLTTALIEEGIAERQAERQQAEDKRFWDGIFERIEARQAPTEAI